jgi:hypothetical protein
MDKITYIRLKDMDDKTFTIKKVGGYKYKKMVETNGKWSVLVEESWRQGLKEEGYRKVYQIDAEEGIFDASEYQLQNMLIAVIKDGVADLNNKTFKVKKVIGKNDIPNYYFNVVKENSQSGYDKAKEIANNLKDDYEPNTIDFNSIPF